MSTETHRGRRYRVRGRVQGVGFRYFARLRADELGIAGWVCNRSDGSVEIEAWADGSTLDRFETFLKTGPSHSTVETVECEELSRRDGPPRGFTVRFE